MKKIKLTQNQFAIVDVADFEWLNKWKWNARKNKSSFHVVRRVLKKQGEKNDKSDHVRMHNLIMNPPMGMVVDHINHNTLDNRRTNLRIVSPAQNMFNRRTYQNNSSGYKGVVLNTRNNKWRAVISANLKKIHLGYFLDIKDAARAYNNAAKNYHGDYALINKI